MKKKKIIRRILPSYAFLPVLSALLFNCLVYWGCRRLTAGRVHLCLQTPADALVPFLPPLVVIYFLAYLQWAAGYVLIGRESREFCCRWVLADIIAKTICGICFLAVPTTLVRPEITGTDLFSRLTALLYRLDQADNLFPSIHCLESWICLRSGFRLRNAFSPREVPGWYRIYSVVFTLLVMASTVCLRQHVLVDIPAGILAAEIGMVISGRVMNEIKARQEADAGQVKAAGQDKEAKRGSGGKHKDRNTETES